MTQAAAPMGVRRGRFVTLEGIDGAGKSTHVATIAADLRVRFGADVVVTREPGGTPLAEALRALFLGEPMDALTEALLVFAARRDHVLRVIEPALVRGGCVLCDRFTDASFAYQGAGRGFDTDVLGHLERWVQHRDGAPLLEPDLTLWFDVPAEEAARRRAGARSADRLEAEDLAFFERVREGYRARAAAAPRRIVRVDAAQAPDGVAAAVRAALAARFGTAAAQ